EWVGAPENCSVMIQKDAACQICVGVRNVANLARLRHLFASRMEGGHAAHRLRLWQALERSRRGGGRLMARVRFPLVGVSMATAIAVGGLYYVRDHNLRGASESVHAEEQSDYLRIVDRSAAYHFGFVNAALAGCPFSPGTGLDRL